MDNEYQNYYQIFTAKNVPWGENRPRHKMKMQKNPP